MSSANAIIKIHDIKNNTLEFDSYETGNADFFANGFSTRQAALMILLDASSEETALTKEIKDMGAEPQITYHPRKKRML